MRLPDANLLIYALDSTSPRHERARAWLDAALSGTEPVAFAWVVLLAVLRLTTSSAVFARPLRAEEALDVIDGWLAQPCATVVHPTRRHPSILRTLLAPLGTGGNLTADAHLAALGIEHQAVVCSGDADFSRFPGLDWIDPIRP
ncbi:MAG TPA: type II toxin-antitoxin system VapC family toxin [Candidatus Binatia bacterium]|nr:type II toxin-antitoxin system VapC family toxin [Candidatus Binatia bacterium]